MSEKVYLTEEGKKQLLERLDFLTKIERPAVVERLKIAREQGDLSENAEYDAAKDELAKVSGEMEEIEAKLKVAVIYTQDGKKKNIVSIGSKVRIIDESEDEGEKEKIYRIVGTAEADIYNGKISNESVVGKSLLGKKAGDTVVIAAPIGVYNIKILEILA